MKGRMGSAEMLMDVSAALPFSLQNARHSDSHSATRLQLGNAPWNKGMKASAKLDIAFFILVAVGIYFALLVEYNIDLLDFIRKPEPKGLHPAERMRRGRL